MRFSFNFSFKLGRVQVTIESGWFPGSDNGAVTVNVAQFVDRSTVTALNIQLYKLTVFYVGLSW